MQLTVKTLKSEKFTIEVEEKNTIAEVKAIIENVKPELPAASMKLILSGKILKNEQTVADCNLKPSTFLVVMITKAKKPVEAKKPPSDEKKVAATSTPAAPTPTAPAPAADPAAPASNVPISTPANNTSATITDATASEDVVTGTSSSVATPSAPASSNNLPPEAVANLMAMGFPEAEVKACLRAAQGNADVAVEFLMNGIPDYAHQVTSSPSINSPPAGSGQNNSSTGTSAAAAEPLAQLRNHTQINQLRRLVQGNPSTLQAVLTQIGEQQPDLLQEINNNQELFLQIMNEPVIDDNNVDRTTPSTSNNNVPSTQNTNSGVSSMQGLSELPEDMMSGMGNPSQMAQMIDSMSPEHLQSMASMMGLTPEQLRMTAAAVSRMPPEELQNYMRLAMQAGGGLPGGLGGMMGGGGEGGRNPPGSQVLRLTQEEMAAVDRLAGMGFDRSEAAQAYIACDKNEELAANLLMDGGFGFQDDSMGSGPGGTGQDGSGGGSGGDMYD